MDKSTRHSKITGDFGENLILYWLSRSKFEALLVDHTGIDIIAYQKSTKKRFGISVKSRSRTEDKANQGMLVSGGTYDKIIKSCKFFIVYLQWLLFMIGQRVRRKGLLMSIYYL